MSHNNLLPGKVRDDLTKYWEYTEYYIRRRWVTLLVVLIGGWLLVSRDVTVNFSMTKGQWSFWQKPIDEDDLFYDPFSEDGDAQNVSQFGTGSTGKLSSEQKKELQLAYVDRYADLATSEMNKHGIPASITLAQGLLESNIGRSKLARENNNHFGLKCFSKTCTKGHCSNYTDDHHKDFFRIFANAEASFAAHSQLLTAGKRYRNLFSLDSDDYKGWARGLKKAGYATDPRYADKLIYIIEELKLYRYD